MRAWRPTNLSIKEQEALEEIKHRKDIVITNADKSDAVVILGVKDYIKEYKRQLNNTEHYIHLRVDEII